jgi:hypothetical protein
MDVRGMLGSLLEVRVIDMGIPKKVYLFKDVILAYKSDIEYFKEHGKFADDVEFFKCNCDMPKLAYKRDNFEFEESDSQDKYVLMKDRIVGVRNFNNFEVCGKKECGSIVLHIKNKFKKFINNFCGNKKAC